MLVEVCANSLESALVAQRAGADRIELCSELAVGGITPSFGMIKSVVEQVSIPVHVLLRPRSGDFTYSSAEMNIMLSDIENCKNLGVSGIVSGVLSADFHLDVERTKRLRDACSDLKFTFHRAFDWIKRPIEVLSSLEDLGVDYILTSGQRTKAIEGLDFLKELQNNTDKIQIMPGSGVNGENAEYFKESGFKALHLSGTEMVKTIQVMPTVSMNSVSFLSDTHVALTQLERISGVVSRVK